MNEAEQIISDVLCDYHGEERGDEATQWYMLAEDIARRLREAGIDLDHIYTFACTEIDQTIGSAPLRTELFRRRPLGGDQ